MVSVMKRENQSMFEDLVELTSMVPWWIGVLLAVASFLILHNLAAIKVAGSLKPAEIGNLLVEQLWVTLAFFVHLILPVVFLVGAVISAIKNRKRGLLISKVAGNPSASGLNDMSWGEFEILVGEFFLKKGIFSYGKGGSGPDSGVDLEMKKNNETFFCPMQTVACI